ncbi:chemotaxis protein CheD [Herbaspirillum sp. RTI4]|uniref:chemotaxis protein CheD n=1 Tax=Herbaspirillum sp. RTI4 TaxID=3048640 RepID=UPI002AB42591|nr:chemotaxis protein CheD [Herbaspirillum sp. RTI4]MDY7578090.1 chemotaxis protein CheD [Herbaspirillum sp. RTI4]MEA9980679.1 chemotaxis protein CheD [Herbaspirillum sp. RTI4]
MNKPCFKDLVARELFLNPGDTGVGFRGEVFGTLLGSCVAITLWHPRRRLGTICHFVFPFAPGLSDRDGRYGISAFARMQSDLIRNGVHLHECTAKIFGGGRMFASSSSQDIGARNIAMARQLVADAGLTVAAENVGKDGYRRLYFDVESGDVWVKFDWLDGEQEDEIL